MKLDILIKKYLSDTSNESTLSEIKNLYSKIIESDDSFQRFNLYHFMPTVKIPYEIAKKIMTNCREYPNRIAVIAEKSCRSTAYEQIKPVSEIALLEKWFD